MTGNQMNDPGIDRNPFIQRAQTQRVRMRNPRPSDYRLSLDFEYNLEETLRDDDSQMNDERRPLNTRRQEGRSWGSYLSIIIQHFWVTIKLIFTLGGTLGPVGNEQEEFDCGNAIDSDERLLASLDLKKGMKFFKTCTQGRRQKKPILLLVITNPDDESQIDMAVRFVAENPVVFNLIKQKFKLIVIGKD